MMGVLTLSAQSSDNEVINNIMARRSVRKYMDKPVEHEKLETVARCGINAPSAMNRQNWAVRIIEDYKLIADVSEVYKQENPDMVQRDRNFKNMFRNAPNLICVCAPVNGTFDLDAGLLGENMMLAAQSLGLGTCIQTGPVRFLLTNEKAKFFLDRLDIPADYKLLYVIAIGYPDEQPEARPRDASKVKYIK
jgi:nitroreductase